MGPLPVYALAIVRAAGGRSLSDVVFSKGRSVYWPPLRHDSSCYVKDGLSWQPAGAVLRALSLYTAALEASGVIRWQAVSPMVRRFPVRRREDCDSFDVCQWHTLADRKSYFF
jgi:hypothetical protein